MVSKRQVGSALKDAKESATFFSGGWFTMLASFACQLVGAGPLGQGWLARSGFACQLVGAGPLGQAWLARGGFACQLVGAGP